MNSQEPLILASIREGVAMLVGTAAGLAAGSALAFAIWTFA